jgi:hypothetical protein
MLLIDSSVGKLYDRAIVIELMEALTCLMELSTGLRRIAGKLLSFRTAAYRSLGCFSGMGRFRLPASVSSVSGVISLLV